MGGKCEETVGERWGKGSEDGVRRQWERGGGRVVRMV